MPQYLCINLARRPDRREAFLTSFVTAGCNPSDLCWIEAIDGQTLVSDDLDGFKHNQCQPMKRKLARLACYLSHHMAIQRAIELDVWPAVIFEDDVTINAQIYEALNTAPRNHFLYLGGLPVLQGTHRRYHMADLSGWVDIPAQCRLYGGHAYCLTDAIQANSLLDYITHYPQTFDSALVRYQKSHMTKMFTPFVARQTFGDSDIDMAVPPVSE